MKCNTWTPGNLSSHVIIIMVLRVITYDSFIPIMFIIQLGGRGECLFYVEKHDELKAW